MKIGATVKIDTEYIALLRNRYANSENAGIDKLIMWAVAEIVARQAFEESDEGIKMERVRLLVEKHKDELAELE